MAETLYTGLVAAEKMQKLVLSCHFGPEALFLAEQLPGQIIDTAQSREELLRFAVFNSDRPCADYTSGRVFQGDREVRWEKQGEQLRVVYLGSAEGSAELAEYRLSENKTLGTLKKKSDPTWYYLYGERLRADDLIKLGKAAQPGDFAVVRIPRTLRYPVENNNRRYVRLAVCEYLEEETGRVALFRFQGLKTLEAPYEPL